MNYKGALGDVQFNAQFHVKVDIAIIYFDFRVQDDLFEIGFAHRKHVDQGATLEKISTAFIFAKKMILSYIPTNMEEWDTM